MDNHSLSLFHFGHLFEIFAGYYLLLGTSKKFHDYFSISEVFKNWITDYNNIPGLVVKAELMEKEWVESLDRPAQSDNLKIWYKKNKKRADGIQKVKRTIKNISTLGNSLQEKIDLHFTVKENKEESTFYAFIKPFYIYFGVLSLYLLLLTGIYDVWDKLDCLATINFITLILYGVLLIQAMIGGKELYTIPSVLMFILSILILGILIAIPSSVLNLVSFMPVFSINPISPNDFQIMAIVVLILLPILTHIIVLATVMFRHFRFKSLLNQVNNSIELPDQPGNTEVPSPPPSTETNTEA